MWSGSKNQRPSGHPPPTGEMSWLAQTRLNSKRVSSPVSQVVAALLGAMGIAWLTVAGYQAKNPVVPVWVSAGIASAHFLAAMLVVTAWKQVRRGEFHYFVTSVFKSDAVAFEDVCAVVEAPGSWWNTTRIHFRRRTCFGWAVSYVPAGEKNQVTAVAKHPRLRATKTDLG